MKLVLPVSVHRQQAAGNRDQALGKPFSQPSSSCKHKAFSHKPQWADTREVDCSSLHVLGALAWRQGYKLVQWQFCLSLPGYHLPIASKQVVLEASLIELLS